MCDDTPGWQPKTMPTLLISTASRMIGRRTDARFREIGISTSQFPVFFALKDGARLTQKELTGMAGVEQSSMAQLLSRMERDGLIQREPDPEDGRSSLISLTEAAYSRIGPARAMLTEGNAEALTGFDETEIAEFSRLLLKLIGNIREPSDPV